jgi:hypothetical protein
VSDSIRFYIDDDPATAGDRKFLARHERGKAGLCWFGPTRKAVEQEVAAWAAKEEAVREAASQPPTGKPRGGARPRKAAPAGEIVDG